AEDGIRDDLVTGVQTCALPISLTASADVGVTPIQHVIVVVQENRTTDNLFQDQNLINAGADIQNYGVNSSGQRIPLSQIDLGTRSEERRVGKERREGRSGADEQ